MIKINATPSASDEDLNAAIEGVLERVRDHVRVFMPDLPPRELVLSALGTLVIRATGLSEDALQALGVSDIEAASLPMRAVGEILGTIVAQAPIPLVAILEASAAMRLGMESTQK